MKPTILIGRVTIKAATYYECSQCGTMARGSTVTIEGEVDLNPEDVGAWLIQQPIHNDRMPVGWAGFGLLDHRCPTCTEKP